MNIFKLTIRLGVLAMVTCLYSACDLLDLAPIDSYGSGNYWQRPEHVQAYMDGLHKNLRDKIFQHQYVFGESRGGTSKIGTAVDGTSLDHQIMVKQALDPSNSGVTKFGELYGYIANVNIFIENTKAATYMTEAQKTYYLGQAYGLRAYYYFDLYRIYGTAPLRLDPNPVVNGNFNPEDLYAARASGSALMNQLKSDLNESLNYFGSETSFDPLNRNNKKGYWSKAATEYLMAEVYLWNAKVDVDDNKRNEADLVVAKTHLESLLSNYSLSLQPSFTSIFDVANKGNSEVIMAVRFAEGEASNSYTSFAYNYVTGAFNTVGFNDENGKPMGDTLKLGSTGMQRIEFKSEFFKSYDKTDIRRDATFLSAYSRVDNSFQGTVFKKITGYLNTSTNQYVWNADAVLYRLAGVYLMLAEIENMQGGDVAKYINEVRQRAYGDNWSKAEYGYTNGDFTQNELAILREKDKELIGEGHRWWDVLRMTLTKGGEHLVFCKEGGVDGEVILDKKDAYMVFWPLETEMINKDPKLTQTPGYDK